MEILVTKIGLAALLPFMILFDWSVEPAAPIDRPTLERIKNGMTTKEVEKLLGPLVGESQGIVFGHTYYTKEIWFGNRCAIVVDFTNDKVTGKRFWQPSLWQRIDDWMTERTRYPDGSRIMRLKGPA